MSDGEPGQHREHSGFRVQEDSFSQPLRRRKENMKLRALATTDTGRYYLSPLGSHQILAASQYMGFIPVENQVFKSPKP